MIKSSLLFLCCVPAITFAGQQSFKEKYDAAAKEMIPSLKTTKCLTKPAPNKSIIECRLSLPNSILSIDSSGGKDIGVWMMLDSSELSGPTDLIRAGGLLLRAARGSSHGDYLAVSSSAFEASRKKGWKEACVNDRESSTRLCVSSSNQTIFHLTLTPITP